MSSATGLTTDTRRFELYFRLSLYALFALEPVVLVLAAANGGSVALLVLGLAQTVLNVLVCRWSFSAMRTRARWARTRREHLLLGVWLAVAVAVVVVVVVTLPDVVGGSVFPLAFAAPLAAIAAALRPLVITAVSVVAGAIAAVLAVVRPGTELPPPLATGLIAFVIVGMIALSFWLSGWMVRVVWTLDDARTTTARLAVAEERLRISRDLHDLFGRTLATIAVKSELAAELIRRDRSEAALAEIAAVHAVADESGQQVREIVGGIRRTDLPAELLGARSLLAAAGVRCVVRGDDDVADLDPAAGEALAAVLREAVTNVIRHSTATECFVTLERGDAWRLAVSNDGAAPTTRTTGNGLRGMGERLAAVDGSLRHTLVDGRFTLEAVVPFPAGHPLEARR